MIVVINMSLIIHVWCRELYIESQNPCQARELDCILTNWCVYRFDNEFSKTSSGHHRVIRIKFR